MLLSWTEEPASSASLYVQKGLDPNAYMRTLSRMGLYMQQRETRILDRGMQWKRMLSRFQRVRFLLCEARMHVLSSIDRCGKSMASVSCTTRVSTR